MDAPAGLSNDPVTDGAIGGLGAPVGMGMTTPGDTDITWQVVPDDISRASERACRHRFQMTSSQITI